MYLCVFRVSMAIVKRFMAAKVILISKRLKDVYACTYVTGFAKTIPNHTRTEIQFSAEHYSLVLPRNTKHMVIDGQVCFHRWLFADPVKP